MGSKKNFNKNDIVGRRFGRLKVKECLGKLDGKYYYYNCECDCGTVKKVSRDSMLGGRTVSCGCFKNENSNIKGVSAKQSCLGVAKKNSQTKICGVSPVHRKNHLKYQARMLVDGHDLNFGVFDTLEEATKIRKEAEDKRKQGSQTVISWYYDEYGR